MKIVQSLQWKLSNYYKFKTIINCDFGFYNFKIYL